MIDREQYEYYKKNGFCICKGLLPEKTLSTVLGKINHLAYLRLLDLGIPSSDNIFDNLKALFEADTEAYLGVARLAPKLISVKALALDKNLQNVSWMLQQQATISDFGLPVLTKPTEAVVHIMSRDLVPPGGYAGFRPHQDWASIQGSLDSLVVWMPLTTITEESFPLQVIPGSHLKGLLRLKKGDYEIQETEYDDNAFVSALMKPGDVAFMSSWTVHRTGIDPGTEPRIAISTRYENAADPTFIKRNYPSAYKRSVHRDLITTDFPDEEQVVDTFSH